MPGQAALCRDPPPPACGQPSSKQPASGMQERVTGPPSSEEEFLRLAAEETVHEKWWQGVRRRRQEREHFHLLSGGQWVPIREPGGRHEWPVAGGAALCGCAVGLTGQRAAWSPSTIPGPDNSASESGGWLASREPASSYQRPFTGTPWPARGGGRAGRPMSPRHPRLIPKPPSWRLGGPGLNFAQDPGGFLSCSRFEKTHRFLERSHFCLTNNTFLFQMKPTSEEVKGPHTPSEEDVRRAMCVHPAAAGVRPRQPAPSLGKTTVLPSSCHLLVNEHWLCV